MGWKVSLERVKLFEHPSADNLVIARAGLFQLVVRKDVYKDGDLIVFAPKRSILPEAIRPDYNTPTGASYLSILPVKEDDALFQIHCRVSSFPLKGIESEGVTINSEYVAKCFNQEGKTLEELYEENILKIGDDISEKLSIQEFKAPIPKELEGKLFRIPPAHIRKHDVESGILYGEEFQEGEDVIVTEKIHGSQMDMLWIDGNFYVSSKNLLADDLAIIEDENNIYWKSIIQDKYFVRNLIFEKIPGAFVQIFAEVIPCQKKYSYGFTADKPVFRIYRMEIDHIDIGKDKIIELFPELKSYMVPELYRGPYNKKVITEIVQQQEKVSGKELHNSEGGVLEPLKPRKSIAGFNLYLKFLNKKFKNSDDFSS